MTTITIPDQAVALIRTFEGFRSTAYKCPAGVWTIGYGTTRIAGQAVKQGMTCTEAEAEQYMRSDLQPFAAAIKTLVKVPLTENQFAALLSFVYNIGPAAFAGSTMLKKINSGDWLGARNEFFRWIKAAGQTLTGLVKRRAAEADLFGKVDAR